MQLDTNNSSGLASTSTQAGPQLRPGSRRCRICSRPLKDPVSVDEGIGPICRGLLNEIAATYKVAIPENIDFLAFLAVADSIPTDAKAQKYWGEISGLLLRETASTLAGQDLRWVINHLGYILSFQMADGAVTTLVNIIRALGYGRVADLILGELVTGPATLQFDPSFARLVLQGPSSKRGAIDLQTVPGAKRCTGGWYAPAKSAQRFVDAVRSTWLAVDGTEAALAQALAWNNAHAACRVVKHGQGLAVVTPYNAKFVTALKTFPAPERRWEPNVNLVGMFRPGAWVVNTQLLPAIQQLMAIYYPDECCIYPD